MIHKRRTLVVLLALLSVPLAALGQPMQKVYRIGVLETVSPALNAASFDALRFGYGGLCMGTSRWALRANAGEF